ncbi:MAG: hypothetical protein RMM08_09420 [Armatimonadota bacterium]|nr:hypothetical protein [Armatimonadota bacterium]
MSNRTKYLLSVAVTVAVMTVFVARRALNSGGGTPEAAPKNEPTPSARISMPLWLPPDNNFHVAWVMCIVDTTGKPSLQLRIKHKPTGAVIEQTQTVDRFYDHALPFQYRNTLQKGKRVWVVFRTREMHRAYLHLGRIRLSMHTFHPRGRQVLEHLCQQYSATYARYEKAFSKLSGLERALSRAEYDVCEYPQRLD